MLMKIYVNFTTFTHYKPELPYTSSKKIVSDYEWKLLSISISVLYRSKPWLLLFKWRYEEWTSIQKLCNPTTSAPINYKVKENVLQQSDELNYVARWSQGLCISSRSYITGLPYLCRFRTKKQYFVNAETTINGNCQKSKFQISIKLEMIRKWQCNTLS